MTVAAANRMARPAPEAALGTLPRLQARDQFRRDGFVLLENVLSRSYVERLRIAFMAAMDAKVRLFDIAPVTPVDGRDKGNSNVKIGFRPAGGNHDLNRWNMHLPTRPDFFDERIIANAMVLPVIKDLLGPAPVAFIVASDTPYPGAGFQNIHQDFPRFGLTVNIPLVDFTEENAPIEVWPGSHIRDGLFHAGYVHLSAAEIRALAGRGSGRRMLLKAGSVLIRDQRLVHRGTANTGGEPRPCLSIWYKSLDHFALGSFTIPVPHRAVADRMARLALWIRREGRGTGGAVRSQKLLNLGNFLGRIVEETAASDRDQRRRIPRDMWAGFSPEMRSLLRYASVADEPEAPRSGVGSALLVIASALFALRAVQLKACTAFRRPAAAPVSFPRGAGQ
jgi:ectoine hydroxylase-related dioxygenase (phytanoyl-CoA dioxygenase family)